MGILLPHIKYKGLLGSLCNYNSEDCWPVVHVQCKHETVIRMGDGVFFAYIYVLLKSMLIQCEHFISKKIYCLEVHVQKTGQLHYILFGKLLNSVSDTFVIVVFKRLLSHHIKKRR